MINIELHGFVNQSCEDYPARIARQVGRAIAEKTNLAEEAVITVHNDRTFSCTLVDAVNIPFIRIYSSDKKHFAPLVKALSTLGFDIETLELHDFYPAPEKT